MSPVSDQVLGRRCSVYPSYPAGAAPKDMSSTLIASYCWTQDAERMGSLINRDGTGQPELMDLVFRDLAAVHGVTVEWLKGFYTGEYFAWDWARDPLTMGSPSLPVAVLGFLNGCSRCICILRSGGIWRQRYLQPNAPACSKRQTVLRWRGGQCLPCVREFDTAYPLTEFLIRTLSTVGLPALWTAHGVPLTSTSTSTRVSYPRAPRRSSMNRGVQPSTGTKLPIRS